MPDDGYIFLPLSKSCHCFIEYIKSWCKIPSLNSSILRTNMTFWRSALSFRWSFVVTSKFLLSSLLPLLFSYSFRAALYFFLCRLYSELSQVSSPLHDALCRSWRSEFSQSLFPSHAIVIFIFLNMKWKAEYEIFACVFKYSSCIHFTLISPDKYRLFGTFALQ